MIFPENRFPLFRIMLWLVLSPATRRKLAMAQNDNVVRIGSLELRFLVDEHQSAGRVVMFEFAVPPEARVPAAHYHREVDEVVYALEGTLTSTLDGRKHGLRNGDILFIPRGSVHTHENFHSDTARALIVMTPGSIGRSYFEEIAAAVNVPGKPDLARIKDIMLRYGLVPA
jgi:quercetin dioxygenase-like cupin family protein